MACTHFSTARQRRQTSRETFRPPGPLQPLALPSRRTRTCSRPNAQVTHAAPSGPIIAVQWRPAGRRQVAVEGGLPDAAVDMVVGAAHPCLEVAAAGNGGGVGTGGMGLRKSRRGVGRQGFTRCVSGGCGCCWHVALEGPGEVWGPKWCQVAGRKSPARVSTNRPGKQGGKGAQNRVTRRRPEPLQPLKPRPWLVKPGLCRRPDASPDSLDNLREVARAVRAGVDAREAVHEVARVPLLLPGGVLRELGGQRVQEHPGRATQLLAGDGLGGCGFTPGAARRWRVQRCRGWLLLLLLLRDRPPAAAAVVLCTGNRRAARLFLAPRGHVCGLLQVVLDALHKGACMLQRSLLPPWFLHMLQRTCMSMRMAMVLLLLH